VFVGKRLRPEEAHGLATNTGARLGNYKRKTRLGRKKKGADNDSL